MGDIRFVCKGCGVEYIANTEKDLHGFVCEECGGTLFDVVPSKQSVTAVRKEDDLYFIGPFWIIGESLATINMGGFELISEKFLVDYDGNYADRVPRSQFTHKGIWEAKYKAEYGNTYDYYPRGRISYDSVAHKCWINIPYGLNENLIIAQVANAYDIAPERLIVKHTDPTSGNHYEFKLPKVSVNAARKEDDVYFEGTWWIIAESYEAMAFGNFKIVGEKYAVDYDGNYTGTRNPTMMEEHREIWDKYADQYKVNGKTVAFDYYPRGRVAIMQGGKAYIYMPKKAFTPKVYDAIRKEHNLGKLDVHLMSESSESGAHYEFKMK